MFLVCSFIFRNRWYEFPLVCITIRVCLCYLGNAKRCGSDHLRLLLQLDLLTSRTRGCLSASLLLALCSSSRERHSQEGRPLLYLWGRADPLCVPYWNSVEKCLTHLWVITLLWNKPWCWERLRAGEGGDRGWDGQRTSLTQWAWVWANLGDSGGQGSWVWCSPWGHKESDMT